MQEKAMTRFRELTPRPEGARRRDSRNLALAFSSGRRRFGVGNEKSKIASSDRSKECRDECIFFTTDGYQQVYTLRRPVMREVL